MAEYVLMKPSEQVPTPGNTIFITCDQTMRHILN